MHKKNLLLAGLLALLTAPVLAQQNAGIDRMTAIMEAIKRGDMSQLSGPDRAAVHTGQESARTSADLENADPAAIESAIRQNDQWQQMTREAYVAALPPRDRARGESILLGNGTLPDSNGRLYYFVSRSMPISLLRAYAAEALYTGGTLVVKGIRRGNTIKEYVEEVVSEFNTADGQVLAALEVNPNLFDMFNVTVVPTTVWTTRLGLDDVGAGCENLPEGATVPQVTLTGPDGEPITLDRPTCAQAPADSFYKISGALLTTYVLERFESAGAPAQAMNHYRAQLAERHANVFDGSVRQVTGNTMPPLEGELKVDTLPRGVLLGWKDSLETLNVQRGPYGPTFSAELDDDPVYRKELQQKVEHGLQR